MSRSTAAVRNQEHALDARVGAIDWPALVDNLDRFGCATTGTILTLGECQTLTETYGDDTRFRSRVIMSRHGFGRAWELSLDTSRFVPPRKPSPQGQLF